MATSNFDLIRGDFPDACITGNGIPDKDGYIRFNIGSKTERKRYQLHRLVFRAFVGGVHSKQVVMHTCDNPSCINPKHLRVGSHDDNMRDMVEKRRHEWGSDHYNSKLTEQQVREIRASDEQHKTLAKRYGVSRPTVTNIRARRIWSHLED
jgi:hypothetical protein